MGRIQRNEIDPTRNDRPETMVDYRRQPLDRRLGESAIEGKHVQPCVPRPVCRIDDVSIERLLEKITTGLDANSVSAHHGATVVEYFGIKINPPPITRPAGRRHLSKVCDQLLWNPFGNID